MNKYRCAHCHKVVKRQSFKAWIKSYCDATGRTVHLVKMP
jgi:phage FluMu protein Com